MHTPVLLKQTSEALEVKKDGLYIDATAGEGGHLKKILEVGGRVLGIDADQEQLENLEIRFKNVENLKLVCANFKDIENIAKKNGFFPVDGIVFDLGLSMRQIEKSGRGFSYNKPLEPLDMRLDQNQEIKASDIINSLSVQDLYEVFSKNSEELGSWAIAKAIFSARRLRRIERVGDLLRALEKLGVSEGAKARIFQALRMEVNKEKGNLEGGLEGGLRILKTGGKMVVLTFHSVEDRWVKRFISAHKKVLRESGLVKADRKGDSFERSSKLRIIVKN